MKPAFYIFGKGTSSPPCQMSCWHSIPQHGDLRCSLSYQGSLQSEQRIPIYDPSILGGHRYTHKVQRNLHRIPLEKGRCRPSHFAQGGFISTQSNQGCIRFSYTEQQGLRHASSKHQGFRCTLYKQERLRNFPSVERQFRSSTSAQETFRHYSSPQGGLRSSESVQWGLQQGPFQEIRMRPTHLYQGGIKHTSTK